MEVVTRNAKTAVGSVSIGSAFNRSIFWRKSHTPNASQGSSITIFSTFQRCFFEFCLMFGFSSSHFSCLKCFLKVLSIEFSLLQKLFRSYNSQECENRNLLVFEDKVTSDQRTKCLFLSNVWTLANTYCVEKTNSLVDFLTWLGTR